MAQRVAIIASHLGPVRNNYYQRVRRAPREPEVAPLPKVITRFTDPAQASEMMADCRLILDDSTVVHVNKPFLAMQASFFKSLFYSDFSEREKDEFPLKDISTEDFLQFLDCLYIPHAEITDWNIYSVLLLADRFDCPFLVKQCLVYMQTHRAKEVTVLKTYVELADLLSLSEILDEALKSTSRDMVDDLLEPTWLLPLKDDTKTSVLNKIREVLRLRLLP